MVKVKNMNLDWCKMESFIISKSSGIGTSGWVAENYLAFARLLPVIYGNIPSLTDRFIVDNSDIICLTQSAFVCVCTLMISKDLPTTLLSDHVKVFLSMSHNVSDNKEHPWWKCGNIVSLLNLKDQMDTYGHIRLYWEGNRERYIQEVKPLMRNLRSTSSYFALKLKQLHNDTSLREVMGKMLLCKQVNGQVHDTRYKSVISYDSVQEVESFLNAKNPVSGCLYNNGGYEKNHVCCMTDTNDVGLFEVIWGCDGIHVMGLWYCVLKISYNMTEKYENVSEMNKTLVHQNHNVILSPLLHGKLNSDTIYVSAITSHWLVHNSDYKVSLPCVDKTIIQ